VNISPRPANFSGAAWQPARSYRLGEQLSTSGDIRVGEPVTRTVIIDAVGLEENMIAEPDWNEIPDARVYPDQPQGISRDDGEWVLGHKEFRYAVVPEREGSLVLPEIKVVWWDTVANQERTSILPSRTINVLAANIGQPADPLAAQGRENAMAAPMADASDRRPMSGGFWPWLTLAFAVLWLATLAWAVARRPQGAVPPRAREHEAREEALRAAFKRACGRNDAAAARLALRAWLKQAAPVSSSARASLVDFAKMCGNDDLARAVRELDAAGFSPQADRAWDGSALYRAWRDWNKKVLIADSKAEPALTDLYARKRAV
jgi:hypothetical protein